MKLLIATRNRGKIDEIKVLLGLGLQRNVEILTLPDVPSVTEPRETGKTFAENARSKALHYAKECNILCIADDSGLSVDAMAGRPGVRSARYAGEQATNEKNNAVLLDELKPFPRPWTAAFLCAAAAALPSRVIAESTGRVEGEIVPSRAERPVSGTTRSFSSRGPERRWPSTPPRRRTGSATAGRRYGSSSRSCATAGCSDSVLCS
ncbi:MAG: non-canonical purine NTP pyrophosphatase [Candidatus Deferrimicrobiaceae bacterium]